MNACPTSLTAGGISLMIFLFVNNNDHKSTTHQKLDVRSQDGYIGYSTRESDK